MIKSESLKCYSTQIFTKWCHFAGILVTSFSHTHPTHHQLAVIRKHSSSSLLSHEHYCTLSVDLAIYSNGAAAVAIATVQALIEVMQPGSAHKRVLPSFWVEDL
jgi:hypothetical protein